VTDETKLKIVKVKWFDHFQQPKGKQITQKLPSWSVGFLVEETEEKIVLATNYSPYVEGHYSGFMTIIKKTIVENVDKIPFVLRRKDPNPTNEKSGD